ncbi:MAG TPA: alpha/beta hydrolase [Prosthecobacter sp.]|nr:alpha/beta hydrolase [Prosthecobacter sp.]
MIPTLIFQLWLCGLVSLGILGGAAYVAHRWYRLSWSWDEGLRISVFRPDFGLNEATFLLAAALSLLALAFFGRGLVKLLIRLRASSKRRQDTPAADSVLPASVERLSRPDGSELRVEIYGPDDGIPIVLSHGWGLDGSEWTYFKREMSDRFRLIVWDEPGLGESTRPANRDYSLDNLAHDLEAVLAFAGNRPAILLGHSIGGMIVLTFCRLFPDALAHRVQGLILTHTTPTNPVRTTSGAPFLVAIQKPILLPLLWLTIVLSPLVRLLNWFSYRNGSLHLSTKRSSFAGTETWEQLDFAARFQVRASPAVLARGMLGMMKYEARDVLSQIGVPTLVVAGDRDRVTLPQASEAITAAVPNARLVRLTPGRHLGLVEHHGRFAAEVRQFIFSTPAGFERPAEV